MTRGYLGDRVIDRPPFDEDLEADCLYESDEEITRRELEDIKSEVQDAIEDALKG
ncbi:hypothetical protein ACFLZH_01295 [Patescibacteria group bacterium]